MGVTPGSKAGSRATTRVFEVQKTMPEPSGYFGIEDSHTGIGKMPTTGRPWRPGLTASFPTLGMLALFGTLACALAVIVVLKGSHELEVGSWAYGIQPNTVLSILAIMSNIFLTFAFTQGLAISYWRRCLGSSSLGGLHHQWAAGHSLLGALRGVLQGRALPNGLAFVAWTLSVIRSPLNQSAISVAGNVPFPTNGTFQLQVAQRLPEGYTGLDDDGRGLGTIALSRHFSVIMREYSLRSIINISHSDCGDTCQTTINTFGFCAQCNTMNQTDINEIITLQGASTLFSSSVEVGPPQSRGVISSSSGRLVVNSVFLIPGGTQINRTCYLQPSVVSLPMNLTRDGRVSLQGSWENDTCLQALDYRTPGNVGNTTTMGGLQLAAKNLFQSSVGLENTLGLRTVHFVGNMANQYLVSSPPGPGNASTNLAWADPTDDMINAIREIAFRTSIFAGTDPFLDTAQTESVQHVSFSGTVMETVYVTDSNRMIAGLIMALVGIFATASLYTGWWKLGRKVSMSPLEIARAFNAPLLRDTDANAKAGDLVKAAGGRRICYGEIRESQHGTSGCRLGLTDEHAVTSPREGVVYG